VVHFFVIGKQGLSDQLLEDLEVKGAKKGRNYSVLLPDIEDSFDMLTRKFL
jgi:hypothetical protein